VQAEESCEKCLEISREIKDLTLEGSALYGLGSVQYSLGNYLQAKIYYQQSLNFAANQDSKSIALFALGSVHCELGELDKARNFYGQYQEIIEEKSFNDPSSEGILLLALGNLDTNIEQLESGLAIFQSIEDLNTKSFAQLLIGEAHLRKGNYRDAIKSFEIALENAIKNNYRALEAECYEGLGKTYIKTIQHCEAESYLKRGLNLVREIGTQAIEAKILKALTELYQNLGADEIA
jgi:tetratricopeptide (TPR) repeat protein